MGKKFVILSSIIAAFMTVAAIPVSASPTPQKDSEITTQSCLPCRVKTYMYPKSEYSKDYFRQSYYVTVDGVEYFFWYIDDKKSTSTHWYTLWKEE
jgi:hypothetical protein